MRVTSAVALPQADNSSEYIVDCRKKTRLSRAAASFRASFLFLTTPCSSACPSCACFLDLAERAEVVPRRLAERVSVRVVPLRQGVVRHVVGRQRDVRQERFGGRLLQKFLEQTDGECRQVAGDLRRCFSG